MADHEPATRARRRGHGPPLAPKPEHIAWLRGRGTGCMLGMAIAISPLLGALYGLDIGLGVATLALAASCYLALSAMPIVEPEMRPRLRIVVVINVLIAVICAAALTIRLTG